MLSIQKLRRIQMGMKDKERGQAGTVVGENGGRVYI